MHDGQNSWVSERLKTTRAGMYSDEGPMMEVAKSFPQTFQGHTSLTE